MDTLNLVAGPSKTVSKPRSLPRGEIFDIALIPGVGHLDYYCGASESVFQIATHLKSRAMVITEGPFGLTERLGDCGFPHQVLSSPVPMLNGIRGAGTRRKLLFANRWMAYTARLWRLLRRHQVKVVYTANSVAMLTPHAVRLAGSKLVTGIRGGPDNLAKWTGVLEKSDCIAVLSRQMREIILADMEPQLAASLERRFEVIYNGINTDQVHAAELNSRRIRQELGIPESATVLLYVAAFRRWKGQLPFIQSVIPQFMTKGPPGSATRIVPETHVIFVGSATEPKDLEYESECQRHAARLSSSDRIHFAGFQKEIWPWYRTADLVVLGSQFEGMPRCVIEAMACGKPVVSYNVCSVGELLTAHDAGIVLDQGDIAAMGGAINDLLRDPDRRCRLGRNGQEFAHRELDVRKIGSQYDDLFQRLIHDS